MSILPPPPTGGILRNRLLAALPREVRDRLRLDLVPIPLALGDVLYEENQSQRFVYFPASGIVSLLYLLSDGSTGEIALVGNDGFVGFPLFLEESRTNSRAIVQVAGHAYRIQVNAARKVAESLPAFRTILLRYIQVLLTQMAQTAVCNRHHTVPQQLCRWILHTLDRIDTNEVRMTQQLVADMLGVRREGVSAVANELKIAGIIEYSRGQILVLDRPALEQRVCECYASIVAETDRLLPKLTPQSGSYIDNVLSGRAQARVDSDRCLI